MSEPRGAALIETKSIADAFQHKSAKEFEEFLANHPDLTLEKHPEFLKLFVRRENAEIVKWLIPQFTKGQEGLDCQDGAPYHATALAWAINLLCKRLPNNSTDDSACKMVLAFIRAGAKWQHASVQNDIRTIMAFKTSEQGSARQRLFSGVFTALSESLVKNESDTELYEFFSAIVTQASPVEMPTQLMQGLNKLYLKRPVDQALSIEIFEELAMNPGLMKTSLINRELLRSVQLQIVAALLEKNLEHKEETPSEAPDSISIARAIQIYEQLFQVMDPDSRLNWDLYMRFTELASPAQQSQLFGMLIKNWNCCAQSVRPDSKIYQKIQEIRQKTSDADLQAQCDKIIALVHLDQLHQLIQRKPCDTVTVMQYVADYKIDLASPENHHKKTALDLAIEQLATSNNDHRKSAQNLICRLVAAGAPFTPNHASALKRIEEQCSPHSASYTTLLFAFLQQIVTTSHRPTRSLMVNNTAHNLLEKWLASDLQSLMYTKASSDAWQKAFNGLSVIINDKRNPKNTPTACAIWLIVAAILGELKTP